MYLTAGPEGVEQIYQLRIGFNDGFLRIENELWRFIQARNFSLTGKLASSSEVVSHLLLAKIRRKSSYDQGSEEHSLVMGELTSVTVDSAFMTSGIQVTANASGH